MKEIVKGMIEKFGLFCVRYSLIIFGEIFDVKIRFDNVFDYEIEIVKLVDIVEKELGDVMLYKVLEEVCYLFVVVEDIWFNVSRIFVVIMDKMLDSIEDDV